MIINGGSCTNVASSTMIEKLKHPTFKHPKTYKLHRLNEENSIEVTRQALVNFLFGDACKDDIVYDVLPMDACDILLGRPWQSNKETMHNCRTYTQCC